MKLARRLQALGLALALLALPLAVLASAYACAPQACSMICCAAHRGHSGHGMQVNCSGSNRGALLCMMKCSSASTPEFTLLAPLPPTQLASVPYLPAPALTATVFALIGTAVSSGFSPLPFQPPRS